MAEGRWLWAWFLPEPTVSADALLDPACRTREGCPVRRPALSRTDPSGPSDAVQPLLVEELVACDGEDFQKVLERPPPSRSGAWVDACLTSQTRSDAAPSRER